VRCCEATSPSMPILAESVGVRRVGGGSCFLLSPSPCEGEQEGERGRSGCGRPPFSWCRFLSLFEERDNNKKAPPPSQALSLFPLHHHTHEGADAPEATPPPPLLYHLFLFPLSHLPVDDSGFTR
jgi:hypothetical protein